MFIIKFASVIILAYIARIIVIFIEMILYEKIFSKTHSFKQAFFWIILTKYLMFAYLACVTLIIENIFIWAGLVWFLLMHTAFSINIGFINSKFVSRLEKITQKLLELKHSK